MVGCGQNGQVRQRIAVGVAPGRLDPVGGKLSRFTRPVVVQAAPADAEPAPDEPGRDQFDLAQPECVENRTGKIVFTCRDDHDPITRAGMAA